jgi:hypothetical protein
VTIAALYVAPGGCYWDLPDVDPWGCRETPAELGACEPPERDARLYAGPWPVVAHPPCARWGRYWFGGPSAKVRRELGDDGGCFAAAIASVRRWGGVLEHPEGSKAWKHFGLVDPPKRGGWIMAGDGQGWTCCVEQGHYGHRSRKATWLYYVKPWTAPLPAFIWGPSVATARIDEGFHSSEERRAARARGDVALPRLTDRERAATPLPFRDALLDIARSCLPRAAAGGER